MVGSADEVTKTSYVSAVHLWTSQHKCTSLGRPVKTYFHQLCADTTPSRGLTKSSKN